MSDVFYVDTIQSASIAVDVVLPDGAQGAASGVYYNVGAKTLSAAEIFKHHAERWRVDCLNSSSLDEIYLHPSYARIIGLGPAALPLIFQDLRKQDDFWFYALRAITGADPVPDDAAGNLPRMTQLWLDWGRSHGYQ